MLKKIGLSSGGGSRSNAGSRYITGAASIGRRDFNDEGFDFDEDDDQDEGVPSDRGYNPNTAILKPRGAPSSMAVMGSPSAPAAQGNGAVLQLNMNGRQAEKHHSPTSNIATTTPPASRTLDQSKLYNLTKSKQSEAAKIYENEMAAALKAEEEARHAKYIRKQNQIVASDEMKKASRAIAEANDAREKQEEAAKEKLSAMALTKMEKEEMEKALRDSAAAEEKRLKVEEELRRQLELTEKMKQEGEEAEKRKMKAEQERSKLIGAAMEAESLAQAEAKRKQEAFKRKEIEQAEADEAFRLAEEAAVNKQKIIDDLNAQQKASLAAMQEMKSLEAAKLHAQEKMKEEISQLAEAERVAKENAEKKLNLIMKSEEDKEQLLAIVAESNGLAQKKIWAERKLRQETEKAAEVERLHREAELKHQRHLEAAAKAEAEAKAEEKRKNDLIRKTQAEREEIKKTLKQADAQKNVKKKAEERLMKAEEEMRSVAESSKKAEIELEEQKNQLLKIKEETQKAKEEARKTREQTANYLQELKEQLNEQLNLQKQRNAADAELRSIDDQANEISNRQKQISGGNELENMVEAEKARLKEHAAMLEELAKEAEVLKAKRLELQKKRDDESKVLREMMEKNRSMGEKNLEGGNKMLKSSGSLYNLLEKGVGAPAEGKRGSVIVEGDENEEDEEDDDDDDWKLKVCDMCRCKRGDLPVVHFAAASGHIDCLTYINNNDPNEISSFDKAQRSPLFYACANNQTMTAVYLIEVAPQLVMLCDTNGDTPLHAASSAGSTELVELLISRGGAGVNQQNNLGISPAHLATCRGCLEILFDAGCDIRLKDKQKRSPLFVSCAMNRKHCAEFITEILEIEGGSFQEIDRRGDTPLHAAACNGSVECCKLLLDLAVEPGVRNKKGLRPIDLAIKRGHQDCEQLLAEFHLHHATTDSHFDSVFFLATLQGHRSIKTELEQNEEVYEIVQKESAERTGAQNEGGNMERVGSMWSLRTKRSVRLQQWGTWICYEDQNVGSTFWYDQKTKTNSWKKPKEVVDMQKKAMDDATSRWETLTKTASMRMKKIGKWIQYTGGMGRTFYFNEKTYEFQWERPEECGPEEGGGVDANANHKASDGGQSSSGPRRRSSPPSGSGRAALRDKPDAAAPRNKALMAKAQQEKMKILQEWTAYRDPNTGMTFWHSSSTNESLWEPPPGLAELEKKLEKMAEELEEDEDNEGAVVVGGLDDLGI